ncbi:MAG TPA: hypothetical protein VEF76_03645 [Patescibacteria group bacterium]|nr:hypothetical protein [Patescibacteria group bacterium]
MKNRLTDDHNAFAAALPDMRAHFESAAKAAPDYEFLYRTIADDLRTAEYSVASNGVENSLQHIDNARRSIIAIAEQPEFYGVIAGDLHAAADIATSYAKKQKLGM